MYLTVKLAGESGETVEQTLLALQGSSFGFLGKKKEKASLSKTIYGQYLNLVGDRPCEMCVQCVESET